MVVIADRQLRLRHQAAARAALARHASTRGCRARPRSSSTTGSCCSRRSSSCSRRCSRRCRRRCPGERITVGPPFFNKWMVPIGLTLLFLTGVGPLIAWRKATPSHLRYQFTTPLIAMAVVIIGCFAFGLHKRPSTPTSACRRPRRDDAGAAGARDELRAARVRHRQQEVRTRHLLRPVRVRPRDHHAGVLRAASRSASATRARAWRPRCIGMVLRGKRRYGGYIVHLGIVLMFIGFAGSAYQKENDRRSSRPAQTTRRQATPCASTSLAHEEDRQKEMVTGELTALVGRQGDRSTCGRRSGSSTTTRASRPPRSRSSARPPRTSTSRWATTTSPRARRR